MSSLQLPRIIYGTAWKKERTKALVISAVLQGFRAIDTACQPKHYREDLVGAGLQELYEKHGIQREDIWLQTKFTSLAGQDAAKPLPYNPSSPVSAQVASSLETSLANLQTTYLDSYILHSPLPTLDATLEAWRTLAKFQDEGKAKLIGVSNTYDVRVLEALDEVRKVQVVQNRWYQGNHWDKDVVAYCRLNGIMYQSFWTLSGSPELLSHPSLLAISDTNGITPEQTLYRLAQLAGITPLSGTTNPEHMKQDLEVKNVELKGNGIEKELESVKAFIAPQ
ncbi:Aldo/keto reductase [Coprinopsis marcescibilis]|uniref:Aldo/keto reductase n=1 Tax=Coprinopsis marcescibilis TaxID=230819 RepID=A0A5C3KLD7_COPMA|nr:Aldo/keto reductase [Coprinopsis marcescibilis]